MFDRILNKPLAHLMEYPELQGFIRVAHNRTEKYVD